MAAHNSALDIVMMGPLDGRGHALVLLHSLLSDRTAFDRIAPRLALERRLWLVNLPGFGASAPAGPSLEDFADRLASELPQLCLAAQAPPFGQRLRGFLPLAP